MHKKYLINDEQFYGKQGEDTTPHSVDNYNNIIYAYIKLKKQVRVLHKKDYFKDYDRQLWKIDKTIRHIRELKKDKYAWSLFRQNVDCKYFENELKQLGRGI